jgi:large subunit ribosomal protein L25
MAEAVVLTTQKREGRGSRLAARLRKQGRVPAVVYGHGEGTEQVSVSLEELESAVRHKAPVVDLKSDKGLQKALIKELQWDHLGKEVLHADFYRVRADERITVSVRVELRGIAPGVSGGGILDQPLHELEVECLAIAVPESVRVPINELQIDQAIHVRDLKLPEGVKVLNDEDAIVVHVTPPKGEPEAAAAAPVEGAAEPEVIGRKVAEGEEEPEKK